MLLLFISSRANHLKWTVWMESEPSASQVYAQFIQDCAWAKTIYLNRTKLAQRDQKWSIVIDNIPPYWIRRPTFPGNPYALNSIMLWIVNIITEMSGVSYHHKRSHCISLSYTFCRSVDYQPAARANQDVVSLDRLISNVSDAKVDFSLTLKHVQTTKGLHGDTGAVLQTKENGNLKKRSVLQLQCCAKFKKHSLGPLPWLRNLGWAHQRGLQNIQLR